MKLKLIALAASAVVAAQAQAAQPTATPGYNFYISGSSALTTVLKTIFANNAAGGAVTTYQDASSGQNYWIFQATVTPTSNLGKALGLSAPTLVSLYKRDAGGSIYGVNPIATQSQVSFMSPSNNFTCSGSTCTLTGATDSTMATVSVVPDLGAADVEPAILEQTQNLAVNADTSANAAYGGNPIPGSYVFPPLTSSQLGTLTTVRGFLQSFGIAVNNNLYTAMQAAQGTTGVPNITTAQVQSLINANSLSNDGNQTWGYVLNNNGDDSQINLVRRAPGSGTQASANIMFSNACSSAPAAPLQVADADQTTFGTGGSLYVIEASSTGNVQKGLDAADSSGTGAYAIGIVSWDKQPGASDTFKFVNLDGYSPSMVNVQNGNYNWAFENTFNYNTAYYNSGTNPNGKGFVNGMLTEFQNSATITALPATLSDAVAEVAPASPLASQTGATWQVGWPSRVTRNGKSCSLLTIVN